MSKKKTNTSKEAVADKVSASKVEITSIAPAENKTATTPIKEEKPEVKETKETKPAKAAKEAKADAKKTADKKAPAKTVVKEIKEIKEPTEKIFVQYAGNEYLADEIVAKVKELWTQAGHKISSIKSLKLYIKPEECAAYYVINEKESGKVNL